MHGSDACPDPTPHAANRVPDASPEPSTDTFAHEQPDTSSDATDADADRETYPRANGY
jgi:hypothetical protein